ncbi:MAG: aminotransferase [Myxococcales bacterium]|nr:aminotransferase [Myxococcales bacterium]
MVANTKQGTAPWDGLFCLDQSVTHLNHGSFGACPVAVLEEQSWLRGLMEQNPVRFMEEDYHPRLAQTVSALADFVGADSDEIALVPNATAGVNTILRSLRFEAGDEILMTDHTYNACGNAVRFVADRVGARVVVVEIPFPIRNSSEVVERVMGAVTPATRLLLIDHITSPTGLILPVGELVRELDTLGVDTLVDGAHAPGMIPLDLRELGAAYYTGNCHKWLCAPKGAAFLFVRADRQAGIRPLAISHGANQVLDDTTRFRAEFDWTGTDDPTAFFCIPTAISHLSAFFRGGFPEIMRRNHSLVLKGRDMLCEHLEVEPPAPDDMLGSLAAVPLSEPVDAYTDPDPLQLALRNQWQIEVPVIPWSSPRGRFLRISAQLYNHEDDYKKLCDALGAMGVR